MTRRNRTGRAGTDSIPRRLAALGFRTYSEYLASPHWAEVRRRHEAVLVCKACGRTGVRLALHHRTYKRLGHERSGDLIKLCDECHKQVHAHPGQALWHTTERLVRSRGGHA